MKLLDKKNTTPKKPLFGNEIFGVALTSREMQCLKLLIRGKTAKIIAIEMGISRRTVESYLNRIKLKFKVHSKAALIDKIIDYFLL